MKLLIRSLSFCFLFTLALQVFAHTTVIDVPFTQDRWTTAGEFKFQRLEGFPNGLMEAKGSAILKDLVFKDGTIDLDFISGGGIATVMFRRGEGEGEVLVLRPKANCPASHDCIQYTPHIHGAFLWDLYPQYQTQAPLSEKGWNHIRIVVSGHRMTVFINGQSEPSLSITRLEGNLGEGQLRLSGHGSWANLVVRPGATGSLPKAATADPMAKDAHFVRSWTAAASQPVASTVDKKLDAQLGTLPSAPPKNFNAAGMVLAETNGLVNLSRAVGSVKGNDVTGVWLQTLISSDRDQVKHVQIGWVREVAVFVNGTSAFVDRNLYGVASMQKMPDGRIGLENGQFDLHLHKGLNRLQLFIDDNAGGGQAFGWGFQMRLDDLSGVHLQTVGRP